MRSRLRETTDPPADFQTEPGRRAKASVQAELTHDAADPSGFPDDALPEVAVLGRSNVGKSTLINLLVGHRRLARTSSTPGKTRRIHFYRLERRAYLVDLPGYGYAAVAREERGGWRPLVEAYLRGTRATLRGALLLVDLRRGLAREEDELRGWLAHERIACGLVFTKIDKLAASELFERERELRSALGERERYCAVSARSGQGLAAVAAWLEGWLGLAFRRPDGSRFA
jgi:GTP-binding protein